MRSCANWERKSCASAAALDVVVALVERAGETIRKDELIARAWPDTVVDEGALRMHVAALRNALGDGRAGRRYIAKIVLIAGKPSARAAAARSTTAQSDAGRLPTIPVAFREQRTYRFPGAHHRDRLWLTAVI